MKRYWIASVAIYVLAAAGAHAFPSGRPTVTLDGLWWFQFAPDDRGIAEQWFRPEVVFPDHVPVPGCWEAAGIGASTHKVRHSAIGVGWYRRAFRVPKDWIGKQIWLVVGGAHRSARVWVNGHDVGEHWGYPADFRFNITPYLSGTGPQDLVIAVDSRRHKDRDPLTGAFDLIDYMDVDWGGIFESVRLEATGDAWVSDLFVMPDPNHSSAVARVAITSGHAADLSLEYAVAPWQAGNPGKVRRALSRKFASGVVRAKSVVELHLALLGASVWTPDTPHLLVLELILRHGRAVLDRRTVRFGLRRVEVRGPRFYLNGSPFFLRGYGDDWTLPREVANLKSVAAWRAYLHRRKAFGFNGVRHHSTMPPDSYLDAADEIGMFVQPELPIAYDPFFAAATEQGRDLYREVWRDYIVQMRNHPCIFAWCMGNEEWNGFALGPELYAIAKTLDPTRPVIDTDGIGPGADRPTVDYLSVQFNEGTIPWLGSIGKYRLAQTPAKPVVVHEMSNISVLPNPADIPKYTGVVKPFWLEQMAARVRATGQGARLPMLLQASRALQASLLKLNIEAARLRPEISGHYQWLFRDYWTQSTGFVNQFDDVRALTPSFTRKFLGAAVLLWDRDRAAFRSGEELPLKLFVSDFRPRDAIPIRRILVKCAGRAVWLRPPVSTGGRGVIGPWTGVLRLPMCRQPVRAQVEAFAGDLRNAWPVWIFPKVIAAEVAPRGVVVAQWLNLRILHELERGASVLLMGSGGLPAIPAHFKPAWWRGDDEADHSYGNFFASHPVLRGYPGNYGDIEAAGMLDNRPVVLLDELPGHIEPIIQCLDVPWLMRRKAYLFEARVGKGKLLVCTLNLNAKQRRTDPAASWVYARLLHYAAGAQFHPTAEIPVAWLQKHIGMENLPDPDTWVEGFGQVEAASEAPQRWYSYREDDVLSYPVRQTDGLQFLTWQSAPVPRPWKHPTVTFVWAGGIGWASEPPGGHFSLLVNGRPVLDFPFTTTSATWTAPERHATLSYWVRRILGPDTFGLFMLVLPAEEVEPGKPITLTVTATAAKSKRWFGLNPYRDVVSEEAGR
jgi:hypothetical protein